MVSYCRLGYWAYVVRARLQHVWMVGRQDSRRSAYYWAEGIVHFLSLGFFDGRLEGRAGCRGGAVGGNGRVRVEVVVVVSRCSYHRAL